MFNEATFREIEDGMKKYLSKRRSISRNVASLNILVHDVINLLYYIVIKPLAKSVLVPLVLTAAASAADAGTHKKNLRIRSQ